MPYLLQENQDLLQAFSTWTPLQMPLGVQTDGQIQSSAYEPIMQYAQVGSLFPDSNSVTGFQTSYTGVKTNFPCG